MASPYDHIPDEAKEQAVSGAPEQGIQWKRAGPESGVSPDARPFRKQRRIFKKQRAGTILSRDEVKAIKVGRKKLRKEMKARGIKDKNDFEMTAASLGLYFDKPRGLLGFLLWLWTHWLGALIGASLALLTVLFVFSLVQQMRGHFTINLSPDMFKNGFVLSETADFAYPTTKLFAVPAEDVPCISINQIPPDVDMIDGEHNDNYFAYTYYIRNEGEDAVDYVWELRINQESQALSDAAWVVFFEDGKMRFYAKANKETGTEEALPAFGDRSMGYMSLPLMETAPGSDQFQVVASTGNFTYYRVIPEPFLSDTLITDGVQENVEPMETHKYTVVLYLEGDDPECNDELIGGTLGVEMNFRMMGTEEDEVEDQSLGVRWKRFWERAWEKMQFWETDKK